MYESGFIWPDWIVPKDPKHLSSLETIKQEYERLSEFAETNYSHIYVHQGTLRQLEADLINNGVITPDGKLLKHYEVPKDLFLTQAYFSGSPIRLFRLMLVSKRMVLSQLLSAALKSITDGNLFVAFICFRSLIENIAHVGFILKQVDKFELPATPTESTTVLTELDSALAKQIFGTRVDWFSLLEGDSATKMKKKQDYEYAPVGPDLDRTSTQIMNAIDLMDKKVNGIRGVYEFLCEFAHPNVGGLMCLTQSAKPFIGEHGVTWVLKDIGVTAPLEFRQSEDLFFSVFDKIAEALNHFIFLESKSDESAKKIQEICQIFAKTLIPQMKNALNPYDDCICASGAKFKFCCGKK